MITWHARLRWLERVKGIDVDGYRTDLAAIDEIAPEKVDDYDLVPWILASYERLVEDLDAEMLSPLGRQAIEAGAASILTLGGRVKLIVRDKMVVTVKPLDGPHGRQTSQFKNRRNRRRVVSGDDTLMRSKP